MKQKMVKNKRGNDRRGHLYSDRKGASVVPEGCNLNSDRKRASVVPEGCNLNSDRKRASVVPEGCNLGSDRKRASVVPEGCNLNSDRKRASVVPEGCNLGSAVYGTSATLYCERSEHWEYPKGGVPVGGHRKYNMNFEDLFWGFRLCGHSFISAGARVHPIGNNPYRGIMMRFLGAILIMLCLCLALPVPVQAAPTMNSKYYCLVDRESGQPILGKNANVSRPPASTTKMMTAILAVEYAGLDETATVSVNADKTPEYTIGLRVGQKLTVEELLKVALIRSANDAAVVLAEHVAGDERFFAYLMSKKAFLIGAAHTRFQNASGLPDKDHNSTAYDLAQIGRYALTKEYISKTVASSEAEFAHPGYGRPLAIHNTNSLLNSYSGADGIKTGTTDAAGKCLVASASRDNRGLIAVVLKSGDRQGDTIKLLNYGFQKATLQKVMDNEIPFKTLKINNSVQPYAEVVLAEDLWLWQGDDKYNIEKRLSFNYNLDAPLKKGQHLGELDIYIDGSYFKSISLVSRDDIDRQPGFINRIIKGIMKLAKGDTGS